MSPFSLATFIKACVSCGAGSALAASFTSSMAHMAPSPLTSPTQLRFELFILLQRSRMILPIALERSQSFSSSITSNTACAAAQAIGLPA